MFWTIVSKKPQPDHICTYRSDIAVRLVLLASTGDRQEENNDPWDADLSPHLEANRTDARVQRSAHEIIVKEIARHANGGPSHHCPQVGDQRDTEPVDHGDGHNVAIVVDDLSQSENTSVV